MKKKILIAFFLVLFFAGIAKAALPALVIPFAVEAVEAVIVRSAGRQIVAELGTAAANNASFTAAMTAIRGTQIAQWLGFGAVVAAYPVNTDIPVAPTLSPDKYAIQLGSVKANSDYKPQNVSVRTTDASFELIDGRSTFGKTPQEVFDSWKTRCMKAPDCFAKYGAIGAPKIRDYGGSSAEVEFSSDKYPSYIDTWSGKRQEGTWMQIGTTQIEPRDGNRRIIWRNDGYFVPDENDPDWDAKALQDFYPQKQLIIQAKNKANEDLRIAINSADKQVQVWEDVETIAPDGKPQIVRRQIAINPLTGEAVSTETLTKPGLSLDTMPAPNPDGATSSNPNGNNNTGGWPDDYARQQTLQSVDTGIAAQTKAVNDLKDSLTKKEDTEDPLIPDMEELRNFLTFKDVFKDLTNFSMPPHASICPIIEFEAVIDGFDLSPRIDAHCKLIDEKMRETITTTFGIVYLLAAFFIVISA